MPFAQRLKFSAIAIVALFGGVGVYFGYLELQLSAFVQPEPQEITLAELAADGYGDNAYVTVHELRVLADDAINSVRRGRWEYVYVPVRALDAEAGLDALVKLDDATSWDDVDMIAAETSLRGIVINEIQWLTSEEEDLLRESFPSVDLNQLPILDHEREPPTRAKALMVIAGSAVLLLIGAVLGLFAWRKYKQEQASDAG